MIKDTKTLVHRSKAHESISNISTNIESFSSNHFSCYIRVVSTSTTEKDILIIIEKQK